MHFIRTLAFLILSSSAFCNPMDSITLGVLYYDEDSKHRFKPHEYLAEALDSFQFSQPIRVKYLKFQERDAKLVGYIDGLDKMDFLLEVEEGIFQVQKLPYTPKDPFWASKAKKDAQGKAIKPLDYYYVTDYSIKMLNPLTHQFISSFKGTFSQRKKESDKIIKKVKVRKGKYKEEVDYDKIPYERLSKEAAQKLARTLYRGSEAGILNDIYVTDITERDKKKVKKVRLNGLHPFSNAGDKGQLYSFAWQEHKNGYKKMERVAILYENEKISADNQVNVGWGKKQLAKALDDGQKVYVCTYNDKIYLDDNKFDYEDLNIGVLVTHKEGIITADNLRRLSSNIEYKLSRFHSVNVIDRSSINTLVDIENLYRSGNYEITDKIFDEINTTLGVDYLLTVNVLKPQLTENRIFDNVSLEMSLVDVKTGKVLSTSSGSVGFRYYQRRYDLTNSVPEFRELFTEAFNWNVEIYEHVEDKFSKFIVNSRYPLEPGSKYDVMKYTIVNVGGKELARTEKIGKAKLEDFHSIYSSLMEIQKGKKKVRKLLESGGKIIFTPEKKDQSKGLFGVLKASASIFGSMFNFNAYEVSRKVY